MDLSTPAGWLAALAVLFAALAAGAAGWYVLSRRQRRTPSELRQVRTLLEAGNWQSALQLAQRLRPEENALPEPWHEEQVRLEGEALHAASEAALRAGQFTEALEHYRAAASLIGLSDTEATRRVVEAMLAEARRLLTTQPDSPALGELLRIARDRQSPCPEASFWLGLYAIQRGDLARGLAELKEAHDASQGQQVDISFYYGAVLLRAGQLRESLRLFAEANKLAPICPLVSWQLGTALLASGGDSLLAMRALQKSTAADALPHYLEQPNQLWIETLPAGSWVRNVAVQAQRRGASYRCPLGFDNLRDVLNAARLALAETYAFCGRMMDAAGLFAELLKKSDTTAVRRGLGCALAELARFQEALPHLRIAAEQEKPPSPRTIGTLALCLARANGDEAANARRALSLVAAHSVRGDAHWARLAAAVFTDAQAAGVAIAPKEVADLTAVLVSTDATDPTAASVYDLLAATPLAVTAETAWLYTRAAQQYNTRGKNDGTLLDRAFSHREGMRQFFLHREWDFDAAERLYLRRWAERAPGTFPTAPGADYAARTEAMLLADSKRAEAQGRPDNARDSAELVLRLSPASAAAHDRLAELHFRLKEIGRSIEQLRAWRRQHPNDPRPHARLAVISYSRGRPAEALRRLRKALNRSHGLARGPLLFLAARCALAAGQPNQALPFLRECLSFDPSNGPALAALAATLWSVRDCQGLKPLADSFARVHAEDPWFHYLAGVTFLVAGRLDAAEAAAQIVAADAGLAAFGQHLLALAQLQQQPKAAAEALAQAADTGDVPTREHALALRGQLAWRAGDFPETVRCWIAVPEPRRRDWHLDVVLPGTAFTAGIMALRADRPDDAIRGLRLATQLGHNDPRLEPLLIAANLQALTATDDPTRILKRLEKLASGATAPNVLLHVARAYRRLVYFGDARRILDLLPAENAANDVQRGLLWLAEGQLVPAERAFADAARRDPLDPAAAVNLFLCRLSLGRWEAALESLRRAAELAPKPSWQQLLILLQSLVSGDSRAKDGTLDGDRDIVRFVRSLGRLDAVEKLADRLSKVRSQSPIVTALLTELLPLRAKDRIDRGDAPEARRLLESQSAPPTPLVNHLLGLAACLQQDFSRAVRSFAAALPADGDDPRIQQNLALTRTWQGDLGRAAGHWRRFLENAEQLPAPAAAEYHGRVAGLVRERMRADKLARAGLTEVHS